MYYEDSAEWWSRCIEAHKHKDEWLARFVGKEDLESQHELARLHSLLADYEKYKDFEDKVDEFVRDGPNGYGLWCPSAPTLRNRFVKKFNSTKSEYTIPLQSTQIEGEPLAMDCTYATAKKIQVPEIRPPDGSKYPTQWAVSNVQNGGMQYCIHTYMHTYIHTYIHTSLYIAVAGMYVYSYIQSGSWSAQWLCQRTHGSTSKGRWSVYQPEVDMHCASHRTSTLKMQQN